MSGGPGLNFNTKSDLVANNTAFIAKQVGCVEDGDAQSAATLACLKRAPVARLTELAVAASRAARPPFGEGFFFPNQDNDFLPNRPSELMRAGKFAKNVSIIASWVTNDGAWFAAPSVSSDEEVLASFGLWLHGHSTTTKFQLLELYPLADFEHMVRPTYDGPISAQYYRAAQMNKDLWFTCPVLDFAWQYVKHGGAASEDVRLYEHNATRYTPAFEMMGVPMWRVAHLSDIPYILNNQGIMDTSASQLELSKLMSRSMASFINTGDPQDVAGAIGPWPAAFEGVTEKELMEEFPRKLTLKLFGGPSGTQAVTVEKSRNGRGTAAEEAVLWEKLFERCEFINSRVVRAESGV
nr:secreted lipase [Quercus suber]